MHGTRIGHQHAGSELGVAAQLQAVLDHLRVLGRRIAAADHEAAMRHGRVIAAQLLGADEVDRGVVFVKVVRHGHDGLAHGFGIGTFLQHHVAVTTVLLARGQLGALAAAHALHRLFHRQRVLHTTRHTRHTTDRIRMSLAQALAPEGVGGALGQQRFADHAVDREHARIPAGGNQRRLAVGARRRVHGSEVLGNARMRVEAVHRVEQRSQFRALLRQVFLGAAAQDQHVDAVGVLREGIHAEHRSAGRDRPHPLGRAARVDADQFHVGVAGDGGFDAAAQVAVAGDADADGLTHAEFLCW